MISFSVEDKMKSMGLLIDGIEEGLRVTFSQGIVEVARGARDEWVRLAQQRLHTSREIYVNGLRQSESFTVKDLTGSVEATIQLVGVMPNNLEFGMPSFDMKTVRPGWLGGGKVKTAKDGHKYLIIPFRHSKSNDSRFGYTGKAAGVSPDLKGQLRIVTKRYGLDKALTSAVGEVATRRVPRNAPIHPYLQGLQKTEFAQPTRTGGMKRTSTLNTFRVISDKSPASSWIHPGLVAQNLLQEVGAWVDKDIEKMINIIMTGGR